MFGKTNLLCGMAARLVAGLFFAGAPVAAQSITQHFGTQIDSCFQRFYSASHLAQHPSQKVEAIQLSHFNEDSAGMAGSDLMLRLSVRLRGQFAWTTPVLCNRNGNRLSCGIECDGGRFYVVPKDGSSLLITGGSDIYFTDCDAGDQVLIREPDDKIFLLHRRPLSNCLQ